VNYDPSADSAGDPSSPRHLYITDNDLEEVATLKDMAIALLEQFTTNKTTRVIAPKDQGLVPRAGKFYNYTAPDGKVYNDFCRRVSFSWEFEGNKKRRVMEMGTGSTMGVEKTQRFRMLVKDTFARDKIRSIPR